MIIGVDLDDVLSETTAAIDKFHNAKYGTTFKKEDHFTFDLSKMWNISPEEYHRRIHEFNASEYLDEIEPIMEAQKGMAELSKLHDIKIITSRMETFKEKTGKWLKEHYSKHNFDLHHANHYYGMNEHKKSHICKKLGADVLIDDCLEYAIECSAENIPVLLLDKPWNQTDELPKNVTRVKDWDDILKKIELMQKS